MSDSFFQVVNQCLAVWKKYKGDLRYRIAATFVKTGRGLMAGGGFSVFIELVVPWLSEGPILLDLDLGGVGLVLFLIGLVTFLLGCFLLMRRYHQLELAEKSTGSVLLFFRGFLNTNPVSPRNALPKDKASASSLNIDFIDSCNPEEICREYPSLLQNIQRRVEHKEATDVFVATLGSVPSLYVVGATLRDGHLPLVFMDHSREKNEWSILGDVGAPVAPVLSFAGSEGLSDILQKVSEIENGPVGVAVSFSLSILESELPAAISGRTVHVTLPFECKYDAMPCGSSQAGVAKKIAHLLTGLNKVSTEVHLFLCAQASFITRLGTFHQDGMMGKVVIHNYNPTLKGYDWALEFHAGKVAIWSKPAEPN